MQSLPQLFFSFFVQRPICSNLFQEVVQFFLHAINANPAVYPLDSNAFYKENSYLLRKRQHYSPLLRFSEEHLDLKIFLVHLMRCKSSAK